MKLVDILILLSRIRRYSDFRRLTPYLQNVPENVLRSKNPKLPGGVCLQPLPLPQDTPSVHILCVHNANCHTHTQYW